ncbi:hypothetical protein JKP88DRAFT_189544 [Tribonema minus]|uniref:Delta(24)-sterol reductase n=1 Tax=Tribonema minus TaxID=303371 RepID=A0A836CA62_9STRA|nr:hypothetical protein JKP88DRAFT_189544 [Tribonema minus]
MNFMTEYRGIVIVSVVLPLSFCVELFFEWRDWFYRTFQVAPLLHDRRVAEVQAQVQRWNAAGLRGKKLMCTARKAFLTMSTRTATFKEDCNRISIFLRDILAVDEEAMIIRTEPLVDMRYMTRYLVPRGYQLAIQVEMEDLTIGGLTMGLGMETNSHLLGLIQETVVAFEVVLSDGSLVRATREENADLFHALPWSHGTLGFLVAVELKLIRIKPYMHVEYIPCHTQADLCRQMKELSESDNAPPFLEATVYSKETSVIMTGHFADKPQDSSTINHVNYFWKPWYYVHVEQALGKKGRFSEYIPVRHYYHRFTRSIFWELRDLIPFGNHPVYRYLLGWLGAPKVSFLKLTMTPQIRKEVVYKHVVQDIIIPVDEMARSIDLFHEWFNIYPLLVFPIAIFDRTPYKCWLRAPKNQFTRGGPGPGAFTQGRCEMFFDLGAYGVPQRVRDKEPWNARRVIRAMEAYTRDVGGYQCLYADTFMSREEFRAMFDHTLYDEVRQKYRALGAFPEVFDKVRPEAGVLSQMEGYEGEEADVDWRTYLPKGAKYKFPDGYAYANL